MYSDKVKLNDKPSRMKVKHGDVIIRSEYNDCVLRNNNRANNRLSSQMQMFDKAQRVIMKDLGKETQFLRTKMNTTTSSPSPRLQKRPAYSLAGSIRGSDKSAYTIKASKNKNVQSNEKDNSLFHSLSNRSMYSLGKQNQRKSERGVRPVITKTENVLNSDNNTDNESPKLILTDPSLSFSARIERKNDPFPNTVTPRFERATESVISDSHRTTQMSGTSLNRKVVNGSLSERQVSATSRLSFIEILQKAEEAKSKGLTIEEHVPRPRTPELLSDYGSDESEKEMRRKSIHIGSTPKSTLISNHS